MVTRQVMISCGAKKRPPPGLYQMRPACPLYGKGDNHRLEALIMTASEPAGNVDA
jgi:hypothetical protein